MISIPALPTNRDRATRYSLTLGDDSLTIQYKDDTGADIPGTYETYLLDDVKAVFPAAAIPAGPQYPYVNQLRWGIRLDGNISRSWDIQADVAFASTANIASLNTYVTTIRTAVEAAQA